MKRYQRAKAALKRLSPDLHPEWLRRHVVSIKLSGIPWSSGAGISRSGWEREESTTVPCTSRGGW